MNWDLLLQMHDALQWWANRRQTDRVNCFLSYQTPHIKACYYSTRYNRFTEHEQIHLSWCSLWLWRVSVSWCVAKIFYWCKENRRASALQHICQKLNHVVLCRWLHISIIQIKLAFLLFRLDHSIWSVDAVLAEGLIRLQRNCFLKCVRISLCLCASLHNECVTENL